VQLAPETALKASVACSFLGVLCDVGASASTKREEYMCYSCIAEVIIFTCNGFIYGSYFML